MSCWKKTHHMRRNNVSSPIITQPQKTQDNVGDSPRRKYREAMSIESSSMTNNNDIVVGDNDDIPDYALQYQRVVNLETESEVSDISGNAHGTAAARRCVWNFSLMSALFSANHGCVVACLSLATSRFGSTGAWQSGILYLTYTASALLGATYIVKRLGARDSLIAGMGLYCLYVGCFWVATIWEGQRQILVAYIGAAVGGVGAGFLWTAQGAYFSQAAEDHARLTRQPLSDSTASLAGIFAFLYLAEEVVLRLLSTVLLQFGGLSWGVIFAVYTLVTIVSAAAMLLVYNYPASSNDGADNENDEDITGRASGSVSSTNTVWYKVTAAAQLLKTDPKMKYMIGLNAVFGLTGAFLNSYVNGEVVPVVLNDPDSKYVGVLSSWVSGVAAVMSLLFGRVSPVTGKGPVLILGALCFLGVVVPFVLFPDISNAQYWGWPLLIMIYTLHGTGRATFEGTLKATFADYFSYEKEGAFANIILQNGLSGAVGYVMTFSLRCDKPSRYCVEYSNGTLHDVFSFELVVLFFAIFAILGYWRASQLYKSERGTVTAQIVESEAEADLLENAEGLSS